ncbi:MAG: dipeptidase [Flavobacteriaceae bacterium]|nr:dipeptidase [Flavobacteriaceae bacterium]
MKILTQLLTIFIAFMIIGCKNKSENESVNKNPQKPEVEVPLEERASAFHKSLITIDTHNDINVNNFTAEKNYTQDLDTQVNLPKMEAGGLDVSWLIVYTGQGPLTASGYKAAYANAMSKFEAIHRLTAEIAPDKIGLATSSEEVRKIIDSGRKVAMIGVENAYPIGTDLTHIEEFYKLGARYISLAHNGHSQLSDSNTGEADGVWLHNGLSELGKKAVLEMNRLGIMIDISHPSKEAIKQMIALSKAPVLASHSSARALCNHSRNLDDELLALVKENGGLVQTVAFGAYLNKEKNNRFVVARQNIYEVYADSLDFQLLDRTDIAELSEEARNAYFEKYSQVRNLAATEVANLTKSMDVVNVSDFVDHIDYLVQKIGIEHVGISSDFDGGGGISGWEDASESFNVTVELINRGYNEEEIAMLWGENLLRLMNEVEAVAKSLK